MKKNSPYLAFYQLASVLHRRTLSGIPGPVCKVFPTLLFVVFVGALPLSPMYGKSVMSKELVTTSKPSAAPSCSLTPAFCNPSFNGHQAFFQLGISRVIFGTIDNSTGVPGNGDPTLHDFTCTKQTTITAGVPESITVNNNTHNQEDVKVYIDYNNDGDFNDPGELAFSSDKKISHTGSITAPLTATTNTVLRMRVLSDFFDNGVSSPCENIDFGQVEEYGVTVLVPVITGTTSSQAVFDTATIDPFPGLVLTVQSGNNVTGTITLDDNAKGVLSGTDLNGSGPYTIASKTPANMQATIRALTFAPTTNRSANTETTTFNISIIEGATTSIDSNTTVISTAIGPDITAISIPNAAMKVGNTVTATITVDSDSDDYTAGSGGVNGTIGGFALGNLSRVNATTYTATFNITNGGTDVLAGSDIPVSVTLNDSGGKSGNTFTTAISQANDPIDANLDPPTASNVSFTGSLQANQLLSGTYTWTDIDAGDTESGTTFKWYRSDDNTGTNKTLISGANAQTYTLSSNDGGKFISFEVTPGDGTLTGTAVESSLQGPVALLVLTLAIEDSISCNGNMDGKISAVGSSGTPPYTFSWNTAATSDTLSNLAAATYTVTLTDSLGIQVTDSIVLTEPNVLNVSANLDSNVSCNGLSNGGASTTVSGGTAPYTYSWSNGSTQSALQNAAAGTYKVTVTDKNGCQDSATVIITEPLVLQLTLSTDSNVTCNGGNNGGASAVVNGGTTPYTYSWSNGGTNSSINGVGAGQYILTVTDSNQCTVTDTVIITEPATLTLNQVSISQHVSCKGGNDGMANVNVSGGTTPYTYSWNNGSQTVQGNNNLPSGTFTLTVTDANGCTVNQSNITVNEPDKLEGGTIN